MIHSYGIYHTNDTRVPDTTCYVFSCVTRIKPSWLHIYICTHRYPDDDDDDDDDVFTIANFSEISEPWSPGYQVNDNTKCPCWLSILERFKLCGCERYEKRDATPLKYRRLANSMPNAREEHQKQKVPGTYTVQDTTYLCTKKVSNEKRQTGRWTFGRNIY